MKNFGLADWAIAALGTHDFAAAQQGNFAAPHAPDIDGKPALDSLLRAYGAHRTEGDDAPLPMHRLMLGIADTKAAALHGDYRLTTLVCANEAERSVTVAVPPWRNDVAAPIHLDQARGLPPERARAAAPRSPGARPSSASP